jgi:GTP cyclohydrolase I
MVNKAYLSLGSNMDPERNMKAAVGLLERFGTVEAVSSVWETDPLDGRQQPDYLNASVLLETELGAEPLISQAIPWIEDLLGRVRTDDRFAPRSIDIDLMLFNNDILELDSRRIPSPEILQRPFVAVTLAEISPEHVHPETKTTLRSIADEFALESESMRLRDDVHLQPLVVEPMEAIRAACRIVPVAQERSDPIEQLVEVVLCEIGEDVDREGLRDTPERVARMYREVTEGYRIDPESVVSDALFTVDYDEMVVVKDIDYFSLCEHHLLPFFGCAHVAYVPDGKVIGLSKIPRIVELFARRLQVQERMTRQIADFVEKVLKPKGVGVVIEGAHMCTIMRGVQKPNARMVTSAMLGGFRDNAKTRAEFLGLIGASSER